MTMTAEMHIHPQDPVEVSCLEWENDSFSIIKIKHFESCFSVFFHPPERAREFIRALDEAYTNRTIYR